MSLAKPPFVQWLPPDANDNITRLQLFLSTFTSIETEVIRRGIEFSEQMALFHPSCVWGSEFILRGRTFALIIFTPAGRSGIRTELHPYFVKDGETHIEHKLRVGDREYTLLAVMVRLLYIYLDLIQTDDDVVVARVAKITNRSKGELLEMIQQIKLMEMEQ